MSGASSLHSMRHFLYFLLAGILFSATALTATAADLNLEVRLIRGANDDKDAVKYRPVDPELSGKLNRAFKWKNYYEITNKTASIAVNHSCELRLSDANTIRVKNTGRSRVEVHCLGHGKEICNGAYTLAPPEWLVLGGNDTAGTAWFIGLRAVDDKSVDSKKVISKN
jgi:hypothetical protein